MATFGWSAGDLILVIQTVGAIIDALDKADGASAQYQRTTAFLKSLNNTLHHLRSATAAGLDPSYTAAVHAQVDLIKNPLTEFIGEFAKYERSLGKGSIRGSLQALPRKLHWAFAVEQKVAKLERKVAGPLSCISILLTQQTLVALACLQRDLPSSLCDAISNMLEQSPTERIRDGLQAHALAPENISTRIETDQSISEDCLYRRLDVALERQDLNLREIRMALDRLNMNRDENNPSTTLARASVHEPYLKAYLHTIAASLRVLWQGLLAISGPELLLLLHAFRILDSISEMSIGDNFSFVDVFGRRGRLPWTYFHSWNVFNAFAKAVQNETIGELGEELAMMDVYGLNQRYQPSSFMVRHELWSYIMRPRLELALGIIVVTLSETEPDCPRCFALRTPDQKCSTCGLLFYRPFVTAASSPNVIVAEPYKVKIPATPSSDITEWSNRGIGYWQPLSSLHWLNNVKRVVSIYTRRPSTRLILFTFDCVLEQLWQTWSTNSKLQNILLDPILSQPTDSTNLISITAELSTFRSSYSPLASRYSLKLSPLPLDQKETFQKELLGSVRSLKSLLRDLRSWLALSPYSNRNSPLTAQPSLFASFFYERFSKLLRNLHSISSVLDAGAQLSQAMKPNSLGFATPASPDINTDSSQSIPAFKIPASPIPSECLTPGSTSSSESTSAPTPTPSSAESPSPPNSPIPIITSPSPEYQPQTQLQHAPLSPTAQARARLYRTLESSPLKPRFWWCGYACDACAFELTNDQGRWHCNKCNYGDYDLCVRCVVEAGGCKGQVVGQGNGEKHVLEWVPHPFLERAWRKWEVDGRLDAEREK